MSGDLFDMQARALRRDRARRSGPALFLFDRAFEDIVERLGAVQRSFGSALLLGAPNPEWPERLRNLAQAVTVLDPGPAFAAAARGETVIEEKIGLEPESFDLVVAIGTLDTTNDLPGTLLRLRFLLKPDSLLIGAIAGGETLPRLRQALRAADTVAGAASAHVHPRIEPASLAGLLAAAGLSMPVVDIDRVKAAYRDFGCLVRDLRAMGATNVLRARPRSPINRAALAAAERDFAAGAIDGRTVETFEILHFAGWSPAQPDQG